MSETIERLKKTKKAMDERSPIDRPKYRLIFEALFKESILSGEYGQGTRLPSENDLVRRFGVSRMTIVKAIKELQQLGLVVRRVGSGTFATSRADKKGRLFCLVCLFLNLARRRSLSRYARAWRTFPLPANTPFCGRI